MYSNPFINLVRAETNANNTETTNLINTEDQNQVKPEDTQSKQEKQSTTTTQQPTASNKQQQVIDIQNHPPKANAGADVSVKEGASVILDAKRSSDPDSGDKLTYHWQQIAGKPLIALQSANMSKPSFTAPNVDKTTVLSFMVTVSDDKGGQGTDSVKVSVTNIDTPALTVNKDTTTETKNEKSTNPIQSTTTTSGVLDNTTAKALSNAQNALKNNSNNQSKSTASTTTPTQNNQLSASGVFTAQGIGATVAVQSNSLVSSRAAYDVIFRTASTGVIGKMELTFPPGTNVASTILVEVSGLGPGSLSVSGQTLIYTVTSPVSVPVGVYLRLEIWRISNPATPSNSLQVQIATKTSGGSTIDTGSSTVYFVRQIVTGDIANNAITSAKIGGFQVGTGQLADQGVTTSKLGFESVTSEKIKDGEVNTDDLADAAVTPQKILDRSIIPATVIYSTSAVTIHPGSGGAVFPSCAGPGEVVLNGGYQIEPFEDFNSNLVIIGTDAPFNPRIWEVTAHNSDTVDHTLRGFVQCLFPLP